MQRRFSSDKGSLVLNEHLPHAFEHLGVDIARALAEVGRHLALDKVAIDELALVIDLLDYPDVPRNGYLLARGRGHNYRAELLRMAADGVFLILLKHSVELEIVDLPLARKADYQPPSSVRWI